MDPTRHPALRLPSHISKGLSYMRMSSVFLTLLTSALFVAQASASNEESTCCSAYYEILSVASDQPDIRRDQSSKASYAFLKSAGDTKEARESVSLKMQILREEIPGKMTYENVTAFRFKHDAHCRALLKTAWCAAYKGLAPKACVQ